VEFWSRFAKKEVSHSMAHYLQAVAALKAEKGFARVGDIAERLGVSKSGVTSMLRTLHGRGYVDHERYACVELTRTGKQLAERTESNRRVLTVFLSDILGVPEEVAAEDACMIEHLVSPQVMTELLRLTSFVRSEHAAAAAFREAFRDSPPCAEGPSGECDLCAGTCLHGALAGDTAGEPGEEGAGTTAAAGGRGAGE
jgi:DtxR family Mn-dependent transcriptional regulator